MRPEDDSCMEKVKDMYSRLKLYHVKVEKKKTYPLYRYSNLFLNAYLNRLIHAEYLKRIKFYSPLGIRHGFLYSINTNINEIT